MIFLKVYCAGETIDDLIAELNKAKAQREQQPLQSYDAKCVFEVLTVEQVVDQMRGNMLNQEIILY